MEQNIYPVPDDYKKSAEIFLKKTNNDFFLSLRDQWDGYFEKKMKKSASIILKLLIIINIIKS